MQLSPVIFFYGSLIELHCVCWETVLMFEDPVCGQQDNHFELAWKEADVPVICAEC